MSANRAAKTFSSAAVALLIGATSASAEQPADPAKPAPESEAPTAPPPVVDDIFISAPKTWNPEPEHAANMLGAFATTVDLAHLEALPGNAAYIERGVGSVFVSWAKAMKPAEDNAKEVRAVLDNLRDGAKSASSNPDDILEVKYIEKEIDGHYDARLVWQHKANETVNTSRTLVWLNADKLLRVARVECVIAEEDAEKLAKVCLNTLASLSSVDIKEKKTQPIGKIAGSTADKPTEPPKDDSPGPTLDTPNTKMVVLNNQAKPKSSSRKKWIFIFGAIVIAFGLWSWMTRKREDDPSEADKDDSPARGGEEEE